MMMKIFVDDEGFYSLEDIHTTAAAASKRISKPSIWIASKNFAALGIEPHNIKVLNGVVYAVKHVATCYALRFGYSFYVKAVDEINNAVGAEDEINNAVGAEDEINNAVKAIQKAIDDLGEVFDQVDYRIDFNDLYDLEATVEVTAASRGYVATIRDSVGETLVDIQNHLELIKEAVEID